MSGYLPGEARDREPRADGWAAFAVVCLIVAAFLFILWRVVP